MQIEPLKTINQDLQASLLTMIETVMLITVLFAVVAIATYLVGLAWYSLQERRQSRTATLRLTTLPYSWRATSHLSIAPVPAINRRLQAQSLACRHGASLKRSALKPPA
jgi:hypothetical protein